MAHVVCEQVLLGVTVWPTMVRSGSGLDGFTAAQNLGEVEVEQIHVSLPGGLELFLVYSI